MGIQDFADMMPQSVQHAEFATRDAYGKPQYGSSVEYSARVVFLNKLVRGPDGAETVARGHVWLLGSPTVSTEDQLTLPDSTTPPILSVEQFPDEAGLHHTKIYFR